MPCKEVYWKNPQLYRDLKNKWASENKEYVASYNLKYRGTPKKYNEKLKKGVQISSWKKRMNPPNEGWEKVFNEYKDTTECFYCGCCLIDKKKNLDHCHDTGEIRAVICSSCNIKDVMKDAF